MPTTAAPAVVVPEDDLPTTAQQHQAAMARARISRTSRELAAQLVATAAALSVQFEACAAGGKPAPSFTFNADDLRDAARLLGRRFV